MELLFCGKSAFPEILRCIREARDSIEINMFIWRNDRIGRTAARELLAAAGRGVKIVIIKDRYGVICESCEENRLSAFHPKTTPVERVQIAALKLLYNREAPKPEPDAEKEEGRALFDALRRHPNVTVRADSCRFDHSKFYRFDDRILILGGINIEDKENGCDLAGRRYADYMVKLDEPSLLADFRKMREHPALPGVRLPEDAPFFGMNLKQPAGEASEPFFGMKEAYLRLIDGARERLTVVMAYLSPIPEFEAAFLRAAARGAEVRFLIPARANFQDDLNKKTVLRLMRNSGGRIAVSLHPGMVHAKLLMSERMISVGSCNLTKKAFGQLDELNLFVPAAADPGFADRMRQSADALFAESAPAGEEELRHSRLFAALEGLVM